MTFSCRTVANSIDLGGEKQRFRDNRFMFSTSKKFPIHFIVSKPIYIFFGIGECQRKTGGKGVLKSNDFPFVSSQLLAVHSEFGQEWFFSRLFRLRPVLDEPPSIHSDQFLFLLMKSWLLQNRRISPEITEYDTIGGTRTPFWKKWFSCRFRCPQRGAGANFPGILQNPRFLETRLSRIQLSEKTEGIYLNLIWNLPWVRRTNVLQRSKRVRRHKASKNRLKINGDMPILRYAIRDMPITAVTGIYLCCSFPNHWKNRLEKNLRELSRTLGPERFRKNKRTISSSKLVRLATVCQIHLSSAHSKPSRNFIDLISGGFGYPCTSWASSSFYAAIAVMDWIAVIRRLRFRIRCATLRHRASMVEENRRSRWTS